MPEATVPLDFPACLASDFPLELPVARAAVDRVLALPAPSSYRTLEQHSPALDGNDWPNYLRCSIARMVHAAGALRRAGVERGRLLDYGAYFGNFTGMFADLGFEVTAIDAYGEYGPALAAPVSAMKARGLTVLDFDGVGRDLAALGDHTYDVVLAAGVIEHVAHTPRPLLNVLTRVLKVGGHLVLDTPNLGYLYKRQSLAQGNSVWPPIEAQFLSPIPYEGHHREYTPREVAWMLAQTGHDLVSIETYNYSLYGHQNLQGRDAANFWKMIANPELREYMTTVSRRREPGAGLASPGDWQGRWVEAERHWPTPAANPPLDPDRLLESESLLADLQAAVTVRDRLLTAQQAERTDAVEQRDRTIAGLHQQLDLLGGQLRDERVARHEDVAVRDRTIDELHHRVGSLQRSLDARWSAVLKRQLRRLTKT